MMMTEEEAKTKWCPMVRVAHATTDIAVNRASEYSHTRCLASECMMWQWKDKSDLQGTIPRGYCGLNYSPGG